MNDTTNTSSSSRTLVGIIVVLAAATLVTTIIRERNKEIMFSLYADVHKLYVVQTAYFAERSSYAPDLSFLAYAPEHGSTVRITAATDTSWTAVATHPRTSRTCTFAIAHPHAVTPERLTEAQETAWRNYDCPAEQSMID